MLPDPKPPTCETDDPSSIMLPDLGPEALTGIKVLDLATLFAGPLMATILSDSGAEVLRC